jgi:plastocyanin
MRNRFQKSAPVGLGTLLIVCLTVAAAPVQRIRAKPTNDAVRHSAAASKVVNDPRGDKGAATKPNARAIVKVSMRNMQFYPRTLKIKKGDVVEWKNDDLVPHTATSASFDSGSMNPGTSWRHTFTKAGQVAYVCTFHPTMTGVVVVR